MTDSSAAGILYTLRGLDGKVRREYTESGGAWSWSKDYVYRDSQLLASVSASNGIRHYHLDHLGSPRLLTDRCKVTQGRFVYFPFGEEASYQTGGQQDPERMRFTGHERDLADLGSTMDDLDYMHARYYSPILGRFMSVDPVAGKNGDSQSWNRYAYGRNNPLAFVDPTGTTFSVIGSMAGEFNAMLSAIMGLAVSVDEEGNETRQAGPPTLQAAGLVAAFDMAASSDTPKFTVEAVGDRPNIQGDSFCCTPGQLNPTVIVSQLSQVPSQPPQGQPEHATQGEYLSHILGEYASGARAGGFTYQTFESAHLIGLKMQSAFRSGLGQSALRAQNGGSAHLSFSKNAIYSFYASGSATRLIFSSSGAVTSVEYGPRWWWVLV